MVRKPNNVYNKILWLLWFLSETWKISQPDRKMVYNNSET